MHSHLDVTVLTNTRQFAALEEEWEELYRNCGHVTPFQSWAWLYSWWESYGEDYELRLVTLRGAEGLLVGLIPLMLERRWGFSRLLFIGAGPTTPYKDVLVRKKWERSVLQAAGEAIEQLGGWQVADLQQLRPEAAAWEIFREWKKAKSYAWEQNYLLIDVKPWEELLMSLSRKLRGNARRAIRRAGAKGVSPRLIEEEEEVEEAAHRLVSLHRELWQGRDIAPEHLSRKFESLIVAAACRMMARKLGTIYEFVRNGEVIISGFVVFGDAFDGAYMVGAGRKAFELSQWSSLTYWYEVYIAHSRNSTYLSLMDGDPPYKARWASTKTSSYHIILGRNLILWFPYSTYHTLRSKARRYRVESGITPQWIRHAAKRYRTMRSRIL